LKHPGCAFLGIDSSTRALYEIVVLCGRLGVLPRRLEERASILETADQTVKRALYCQAVRL
jgi:hypothetical protein